MMIEIDVEDKLNYFLEDRLEKFSKVTKKQKVKWVNDIEKNIIDIILLDDNDIFYDNMPEDVVEK